MASITLRSVDRVETTSAGTSGRRWRRARITSRPEPSGRFMSTSASCSPSSSASSACRASATQAWESTQGAGEDRVVLDQQRAHEASVTVEKAAWQRARRAWEVTCMIMRLWGRGKNGTVLRVTCHAVVHGRQTDRTVGPIVNLVSFEVSSPKRRR